MRFTLLILQDTLHMMHYLWHFTIYNFQFLMFIMFLLYFSSLYIYTFLQLVNKSSSTNFRVWDVVNRKTLLPTTSWWVKDFRSETSTDSKLLSKRLLNYIQSLRLRIKSLITSSISIFILHTICRRSYVSSWDWSESILSRKISDRVSLLTRLGK